MNSQVKQRWIEALRSGEYDQGFELLRKGATYCCLGVLCNLYGKEHNEEWTYSEIGDQYRFMEMLASLPAKVVEWADLEFQDPYCRDKTDEDLLIYLSALNDSGLTFEEIADAIEEHF